MPKLEKRRSAVSDDYWFVCPGCDQYHRVVVRDDMGAHGVSWGFNGDLEKPTFIPSVRCMKGKGETTCHFFIREGKIEFCSDSPHALAGQTVELPDVPPEGLFGE